MNIMEYYQKKANNYFNISMYIMVGCFLFLLYGLVTVMSKHFFNIACLLICVSIIFQIMSRFYESKISTIHPTIIDSLDDYYYINFQNRPIIHLNFYSTNGQKLLEVRDYVKALFYYFLPKRLVVSEWEKVTLSNKMKFYINWRKKELKFLLNKEEFTIKQIDNQFLVNDVTYVWNEQPLLFNFEIIKENEVVLIGQKGKMKVKEAEIFKNPNMPSIRFYQKVTEKEKVILIAILVLKWSGKYS